MQYNTMDRNIIITEPSSNLRALGRNALAGKWKEGILAIVIYYICLTVPPAILDALFGVSLGDMMVSSYYGYYGVSADVYSDIYNSMPSYSPISGIYELLVTGAFNLGITLFFLAIFRRQIVEITDIFLGFEKFGKALGLFLFQALFVFLWALLFVVPGIIAALRYSQAFFILADDPNKSIRQCMDESKAMMKGNKAKFFCMNLSFIGWMILASVPAGILSGIASALYAGDVVIAICDVIGTLFMAPVMAYIYSTSAGFYEILAGHLIKETEPAPIEPEAIPVSKTAEAGTVYEKPAEPAADGQAAAHETAGPEAPAEEKPADTEKKDDNSPSSGVYPGDPTVPRN